MTSRISRQALNRGPATGDYFEKAGEPRKSEEPVLHSSPAPVGIYAGILTLAGLAGVVLIESGRNFQGPPPVKLVGIGLIIAGGLLSGAANLLHD